MRHSAGRDGWGGCSQLHPRGMEDGYVTVLHQLKVWKGKTWLWKEPRQHFLEAIGILKKATDMEDKYLIYKINNSQFNREPDYVFKSSTTMAQPAIDMDQNVPEHPLQCEEAYFDRSHSWCVGYKTLALFVYHPAMQQVLRLAIMEVKMSQHMKCLFWMMFNEILSEIMERDYNFNLKGIMVDENSPSYCMIKQVFYVNSMISKVESCQMHYKSDINRVSEFGWMCTIATVWHSTVSKNNGWRIANLFPDISHCMAWWDARKYHMFPAFRYSGYSNIHIGQKWQYNTQVLDTVIVIGDCMTWHIFYSTQIQEFKSFIAQAPTSSGRGPCFLTQDRADRTIPMHVAKVHVAGFSNKHAQQEATEENTDPQVFVPASCVWYRPPSALMLFSSDITLFFCFLVGSAGMILYVPWFNNSLRFFVYSSLSITTKHTSLSAVDYPGVIFSQLPGVPSALP